MAGAAFPILVAAGGQEDDDRLAYALQRLAEASMLVAALLVVPLVIAAEPLIRILGGAEFGDAAGVLALQAPALIGAFLTQVWVFGLLALHRDRALVLVNAYGLVVAFVLGMSLIPPFGAEGAAGASVPGELVLACASLALLRRARPDAAPEIARLARPLLALAAGLGAGFTLLALDLPAGAAGALALVLAAIVALAVRAVPQELRQAVLASPLVRAVRR